MTRNVDDKTVGGFGREWSRFTQSDRELTAEQRARMFADYFDIFPWSALPRDAVGIDVGCGSGRWAMLAAPRVGHLHLVDISAEALAVARANLANAPNVTFHLATIEDIPLPDGSLDFAYSLGVLHHVPDTARAIRDIARKLKPGAPFLVYLYYAFDNRPPWYRLLWRASTPLRLLVSRLPYPPQVALSQLIALLVYWPLARLGRLLEMAGALPRAWPLAYYRDKSLYVMRTDAFDRFCTRLEQRFTRAQIETMLRSAGFSDIRFSPSMPFWCALGVRDQSAGRAG
jgi:ubiquinone/menaquinone biosynthesis C-methylase UbiE